MNPKPSVKTTQPGVTPHVGAVDSLRWRGFRQSGPFLTLLESLLSDTLQIISAARTINPFRPTSTLRNTPQRGTDMSLMSTSTQTYAIQIESLRMQLNFLVNDMNS